jgi:hypothetical protein
MFWNAVKFYEMAVGATLTRGFPSLHTLRLLSDLMAVKLRTQKLEDRYGGPDAGGRASISSSAISIS